MTVPEQDQVIVARFWTRARRFPKLIGKGVNGDKIPGGPYTTTQAIGGAATIWILWKTIGLWGSGQIIVDLVFLAAASWGMLWILGRLPLNSRNPLIAATGIAGAASSPRRGNLAGRALTDSRFGLSRRRILPSPAAPVWSTADLVPTTTQVSPASTTTASAEPRPSETPPQVADPAPLTGLQQLLADAGTTHQTPEAADTAQDWEQAGLRVQELIGAPQR